MSVIFQSGKKKKYRMQKGTYALSASKNNLNQPMIIHSIGPAYETGPELQTMWLG